MPHGFTALIAAQFVSGLADNALLIVTIARLAELGAPLWLAPLLKLALTLAYVLLAPLVGAFADSRPKRGVMMLGNGLKAGGCLLMLLGGDPLVAFAIVGIGAAAYSPAKYGLITELVPPERLVRANAWIEVCTVGAILLGTVIGGALVTPFMLNGVPWPLLLDAQAPTRLVAALAVVLVLYGLAAALNLGIPAGPARRAALRLHAGALLRDFARDNRVLWHDAAARVSLSVTTLFWGVGATVQLIVLRWAGESLGLGLHEAALLQAASAVGIVAGAVAAGRWVRLERARSVLPLGIAMGLMVPGMTAVDSVAAALPLLLLVGACAGFFVVPMNALLQHRGHRLLSPGRSIAVQNFSENLGVVVLLAAYAAGSAAGVPLDALIWSLGLLVALAMAGLNRRRGQREAAPLAAREQLP